MAISPPSDLVMDVVKAADPSQVQAAQEKLAANRAAFAASSLAENGQGFENVVTSAETSAGLGNVRHTKVNPKDVPETYRKFEAVVMQSFVKSMLPTESEDVYGKGAAGDIWKGMMAEQFGNVIAKSGGIGIADQMYSESLARAQNRGVVNASTDKDDRNIATSMITDFERKTFSGVTTDDQKKTPSVTAKI